MCLSTKFTYRLVTPQAQAQIREVATIVVAINGAGFEVNEQFWLPSSFIKEKKN